MAVVGRATYADQLTPKLRGRLSAVSWPKNEPTSCLPMSASVARLAKAGLVERAKRQAIWHGLLWRAPTLVQERLTSASQLIAAQQRTCPDVAEGPIPLKKAGSIPLYWLDGMIEVVLCGPCDRHRDQLGHLPKVLCSGCESELVACAVWAS